MILKYRSKYMYCAELRAAEEKSKSEKKVKRRKGRQTGTVRNAISRRKRVGRREHGSRERGIYRCTGGAARGVAHEPGCSGSCANIDEEGG